MMTRVTDIAIWFVLAAQAAAGSGDGVPIKGQVVDVNGTPVPSATVSFRRIPQYTLDLSSKTIMRLVRTDSLDYVTTVPTSPDGMFEASGLPDGGYYVCVQPPSGFLNSCVWGAGQAVSVPGTEGLLRIAVSAASNFSFRVSGGNAGLLKDDATVLTPALKIGVFDVNGRYYHALIQDSDFEGATYSVSVKPNASYKLNVSSLRLHVVNQAGQEVDSRRVLTPSTLLSPAQGRTTAIHLQIVP